MSEYSGIKLRSEDNVWLFVFETQNNENIDYQTQP